MMNENARKLQYDTFQLLKDGFYAECKRLYDELPVALQRKLLQVIKAEKELIDDIVEPS